GYPRRSSRPRCPPPGHARPARPPDPRAGPAPWARHRRDHPGPLRRHAPRRSRLPLSGPAAPRAARVDRGGLGHLREQPPRALLLAHRSGAQAAGRRDGAMERPRRVHPPGPGPGANAGECL
ncbi:MAG: Transcriptional regulator, PadR family, partial [uncultured Gemmatimonadaceae bacterium]